jgi:hypothetical protein
LPAAACISGTLIARLVRRAGTRRNHDAVGLERKRLLDGQLVVAHDGQLRAQLAQILHQVIGKAVVVVNHQNLHGTTPIYE